MKEHDHVQTELLEAKVAQPLQSQKFSAFENEEGVSDEDGKQASRSFR